MAVSKVSLQSVITCPHCGFPQEETMPVDACLFFYDCPNCGALLRPAHGDCCVFCSYGSVKCPPMQNAETAHERACCSHRAQAPE
jgi:hypothetical protein